MDESFTVPNDTHPATGRFQADFEEVMEMMNAEQQLDHRLRLLRTQHVTQWRELKPDTHDRLVKSTSRRASKEGSTQHKLLSTNGGSCDASSEESDHQLPPTAQQLMSSSMVTEPNRSMSSSMCTAAGSLPEGSAWWSRKRRHLKGMVRWVLDRWSFKFFLKSCI